MAKKNAAERLSFSAAGIKASFQGYSIIITVNVRVTNPSDKAFSVQSLSGELYVNEDWIGEVSSYQNRVIQPFTDTIYPVTMNLPYDNVTQKIFDLINNFTGVDVRLTGSANVDGVNVPTNIYYKVV